MPLDPALSAKFADPTVRAAIAHWVMFCVNQMGQVKSEKVIKLSLMRKLKGRLTKTGVDFIWNLALSEFKTQQHAANQQN